MGFPGYKAVNVFPARLKEIFIVTKGFPKTNAEDTFESMKVPLRQEAEITATHNAHKDVARRAMPDSYKIDGKILIYDNRVVMLQNLMKLSREEVQVFALDRAGQYINFTYNAGSDASPSGSDLLSLGWKLHISEKDRNIEAILMGQLTAGSAGQDGEMGWLLKNADAYETGGSGGTTNDLADVAYARSSYVPAGWKYAQWSGNKLGHFEDLILEIESEGTALNKGKKFGNKAKIKITFKGKQTNFADDLLAAHEAAKADDTLELVDFNGATWTFNNCLGLQMKSTLGSDKANENEITFEGESVYNVDEGSPDSIDLDTVTAPTFELIGY